MNDRSNTPPGWLSQLLKTIWTFFPSILFIFLTAYCFWMQSAGKDIIVAFTERRPQGGLSRIVFFSAIAFWVYVTWYSSRMIVYIKQRWPQDALGPGFLEGYPRLAGNACFLVLELAVLQSPVFARPMGSTMAMILFFVGLPVFYFIDKWVRRRVDEASQGDRIRRVFRVVLILFLVLLGVAALFLPNEREYRFLMLGLLCVEHFLFFVYSHLHRADVQQKMVVQAKTAPADGAIGQSGEAPLKSAWERAMNYFCIPKAERSYFVWFNIVGAVGVILYTLTIFNLGFAKGAGPFPFLILAFGVLLGLADLITGFSVRYGVNFHFLLFLLAFFLGLKETHDVKTFGLKNDTGNGYAERPDLETYLRAWLNARVPLSDTAGGLYDTYFILSNGGASRSGYWTAAILGGLEDSTLAWMNMGHGAADGKGPVVTRKPGNGYGRFSDHIFCLSGTSGGGVGVAAFFSMLSDRRHLSSGSYAKSAKAFLQQDYFTFTVARMLGPDYLNYITHFSSTGDRGRALEEGLEWSSQQMDTANYMVPFYAPLSAFRALDRGGRLAMPLLFINTTRMQDGNPGVVTNLRLDSGRFNKRVDVLSLLDTDKDVSLASGAILGARFPYLSPAGNIANNYFVDGGYFDNSGAGVVQETMQGIVDIVRKDSLNHGTMYRQLRRLRFRVLHIVNSPVGPAPKEWQPVKPISNDLFSPLITIVGAYDMQTTVNDMRLYHFIRELAALGIVADHHRISLYKEVFEWQKDARTGMRVDTEAVYPMNWFMSGRTRARMDRRLEDQPVLEALYRELKRK